jgi:hypothetical protein
MKAVTVDLNGEGSVIPELVAMAMHNASVTAGDEAEIQLLVDGADLVLAVFPDVESPKGVGLIPIKGSSAMLRRGSGTLRIAALKVASLEAACNLAVIHGAMEKVS